MFEERRNESLCCKSPKSVRIEEKRHEDVWSYVNQDVEGIVEVDETGRRIE